MMAVSQTTRYEVLRRDAFTCRYCGSKAPDVTLHVDHVNPVALGGSDDPSNLVAACVDCNRGKSSSSPNAEVVADVAADAMRWAKAIEQAANKVFGTDDEAEVTASAFAQQWADYTNWRNDIHYLPDNWRAIVVNYRRQGLPDWQITQAVDVAMSAKGVNSGDRFRYFCGVCRRKIERIVEAAQEIVDGGDA